VLPHVIRGAERAAAAQALLEDRDGDGVPDALQPVLDAQRRLAEARATAARDAQRREQCAHLLGELRAQRDLERARTFRWVTVLRIGVAGALVYGFLWTLVLSEALEIDPWLGLHSTLACPLVCNGCRGPYQITHADGIWKTPVCEPSRTRRNASIESHSSSSPPDATTRRLPGGMWTLFASSAALWLAPALGVAALYVKQREGEARRKISDCDQRIASLERELGLPSGAGAVEGTAS